MHLDPNLIEGLPDSLEAWKERDVVMDPEWFKPWELLRPFFQEAGYELYDPHTHGQSSTARSADPPAADSFGLYGDRSNFKSRFLAPRNNRDVVIKPVSKGDEGRTERQILQVLNSAPLRSNPANPALEVIEFIELHDFCFAVMPCCDACDDRPFLTSFECLEFAEQVLEDLSNENILINHRGTLPPSVVYESLYEPPVKITPPLQWRSTFPAKYYFIDFGCSAIFSKDAELSQCFVDPYINSREQRPSETYANRPFNPFAVDVYYAARLFYGWFPVRVGSFNYQT
ncbi:hypothetical protein CVT26_004781 [Gymnopilus dilepis]|uniref:Protein kinase domain-containing protein n=1 Tax=Gymnopilus dilepis TaxID=231916 RepID=A0A409XZG8_9AGAR|nr:hypothetical protein CVT26_004781 [Gymnopilus dilepis]